MPAATNDMHILICDDLDSGGIQILRQHFQVDVRSGISAADLTQIISHYQGIVVRGRTKLTAEILARAAHLKIIARAGTGVDTIDLAAARAQGVVVVNTPDATTLAVAEHTLALILALTRHLPQADTSLKTGRWEKQAFMGKELAGKHLGIIGVGRIGQAVAERAHAFGLNLLGYDPAVPEAQLSAKHIQPVNLKDLFARSDIITIHTPLTAGTRRLIDAAALTDMKPGVLLVSTARGGIIDEQALLAGLNSGQVAGAALDVFEKEAPVDSELVRHPNLIATPHIAAQTQESQARAAVQAAEEIVRFATGLPLRWQIG